MYSTITGREDFINGLYTRDVENAPEQAKSEDSGLDFVMVEAHDDNGKLFGYVLVTSCGRIAAAALKPRDANSRAEVMEILQKRAERRRYTMPEVQRRVLSNGEFRTVTDALTSKIVDAMLALTELERV